MRDQHRTNARPGLADARLVGGGGLSVAPAPHERRGATHPTHAQRRRWDVEAHTHAGSRLLCAGGRMPRTTKAAQCLGEPWAWHVHNKIAGAPRAPIAWRGRVWWRGCGAPTPTRALPVCAASTMAEAMAKTRAPTTLAIVVVLAALTGTDEPAAPTSTRAVARHSVTAMGVWHVHAATA